MSGDISLTQALGGLRIANPDDSPASPSPPPAEVSSETLMPGPLHASPTQTSQINHLHGTQMQHGTGLAHTAAPMDSNKTTGVSRSVAMAPSDMGPFIPNSNDYSSRLGPMQSTPMHQQTYPPVSNPLLAAPRNYGQVAGRPISGIYNHPNVSGGSQSSSYSSYRYGDDPPQSVAPPHRTSSRSTPQHIPSPAIVNRDGSRGGDYIMAGGALPPPRRSSRRVSPNQSAIPTPSSSIPHGVHPEDGPLHSSEDWKERGAAVGVRREVDAEGRTYTTVTRKGVLDFEFGRTLGEGSYSTVCAATDKTTLQEYAIKKLDKRHIIREKKTKYVNIEKDALRRLNDHPGIVKLYYTFQDEYSLYFVLDLAKYGELLTWLKKTGTFNEDCTKFYGAQILDTIDYMHSRGILHRDLKPENVLLDANMHVKITDFGTAKILDEPSRNTSNGPDIVPESGRRRAASFVGTAEYVSPELLSAKEGGKPTDLWAFGCIIYQLLTGRPPFKGNTEWLTFEKIMRLDYTFPQGFPSAARDLVERLLVSDPSKRLSIDHVKNHEFFTGIQWGRTLWKQKAPRLKPYEPQAEPIRLNGKCQLDIDAILDIPPISKRIQLTLP
jgi:3-phosphoinositide dependent protein kinase-1